VPAFPTGCYSSRDDFAEMIAAALDALSKEIGRQEQINSELSSRLAKMDAAEKQSRVQSFMMNNPQEAMKLMQRSQAMWTAFADTGVRNEEKRQKLEGELKDLQALYNAALDKALAPFGAKFKDLDAWAQKDLVIAGEGHDYPKWAIAEWDALTSQSNAEYERVRGDWWPASGPFHAWLKRYRDYLVQDQIPPLEEADNVGDGFMVHLLDTPTTSFKSTATMNAIRE